MLWSRISLLLCVFGFLKEFRPFDPYIVQSVTGPWKNFTEEQVNQEFFPVVTYSHFAISFAVLLLTDFLRYKPIIVLCGLAGSFSYTIIIFAKSTWEMQIYEFFVGLFYATEVAYYTYIYAKVSKVHYQEVTSHTRVAVLLGSCTSSLVSQLIVSFNVLHYYQLTYLSLSGLVFATVWACFLPPAKQSIYFNRPADSNSNDISSLPKIEIATIELNQSTRQLYNSQDDVKSEKSKNSNTFTTKIKTAYYLLWKDFLLAYSNSHVLKWSIWWAFSTAGFFQAVNYAQLLWKSLLGENDVVYNAGVDAVSALSGALAALAVAKLRLNWPVIGEAALSVFALVQGFLLIFAAEANNIWYSYAAYTLFGIAFQATITIASYATVFGINTTMSLTFQSILTYLIAGPNVFYLSIKNQFIVYGGFFIVLGLTFMTTAVFTIREQRRSGEKFEIWKRNDDTTTSL